VDGTAGARDATRSRLTGAMLVSAAVHVGALAALALTRAPRPRPAPPVYRVDLVAAPPGERRDGDRAPGAPSASPAGAGASAAPAPTGAVRAATRSPSVVPPRPDPPRPAPPVAPPVTPPRPSPSAAPKPRFRPRARSRPPRVRCPRPRRSRGRRRPGRRPPPRRPCDRCRLHPPRSGRRPEGGAGGAGRDPPRKPVADDRAPGRRAVGGWGPCAGGRARGAWCRAQRTPDLATGRGRRERGRVGHAPGGGGRRADHPADGDRPLGRRRDAIRPPCACAGSTSPTRGTSPTSSARSRSGSARSAATRCSRPTSRSSSGATGR
jgi:hypothetical protein